MKVGITGHQHLEEEDAWIWVESAVRAILAKIPRPLVGISSLAVGADQLFAKMVLEVGGSLYAVIPFPSYERAFPNPEDLKTYRCYVQKAQYVETLEPCDDDEQAYFAAGQRVVELADRMIAVWNGEPARGLGGTGDVVRYAQEKHITVVHLNPAERLVRCV